ncbi:MAG: hypothetical protein IJ661_02090 [Lachnospiraceae bacterium]|nr:hypothetical protein [Lachnospiraceae bacterium]
MLKGNHEAMFLDWINECRALERRRVPDDYFFDHQWLISDSDCDLMVFKTLVGQWEYDFFTQISRTASSLTLNKEAARLILSKNKELVSWMGGFQLYYETDKQIFVHAGVDEEAGEYWKTGTSDEMFLWKYPAVKGSFCKTIIAGHVSTARIAGDRGFHDIFYDGLSHYYIDGTVSASGRIPLLMIDTDEDKYYQVTEEGKREIKTGFEIY